MPQLSAIALALGLIAAFFHWARGPEVQPIATGLEGLRSELVEYIDRLANQDCDPTASNCPERTTP